MFNQGNFSGRANFFVPFLTFSAGHGAAIVLGWEVDHGTTFEFRHDISHRFR